MALAPLGTPAFPKPSKPPRRFGPKLVQCNDGIGVPERRDAASSLTERHSRRHPNNGRRAAMIARHGESTWLRGAGIVLLMVLAHGARAESSAPPRWWGGFGLGYGYLRSDAPPAPAGSGGVWLEVQFGVRVAPAWLAGVELGGLGMQASGHNYDPYSSDQSIYGQGITNEFLIVQFAPAIDRGWFATAGVGGLLYHNHALESATLHERSGNGFAGLIRFGYDWKPGRRMHVGVDLSYERGDVRLNAPLAGKFGLSMIATDFRIAYY
jgi:hypothetical protein